MARYSEKESCKAQRMMQYQNADINDKLMINLRDLSHTMRFLYEGKASQKRILIILYEAGSMTQRALTKRLGIMPGSASEVIAKLEHAGLVKRTPNPDDRRTADIRLTDAGRELALEAARQRKKRHEEMFSCLSYEEKQVMLSLLEKIYADWESRFRDERRDHPERCDPMGCFDKPNH